MLSVSSKYPAYNLCTAKNIDIYTCVKTFLGRPMNQGNTFTGQKALYPSRVKTSALGLCKMED